MRLFAIYNKQTSDILSLCATDDREEGAEIPLVPTSPAEAALEVQPLEELAHALQIEPDKVSFIDVSQTFRVDIKKKRLAPK
jgi:hypothetical protein